MTPAASPHIHPFPICAPGAWLRFFTAETFAPSQKLLGTVRWCKSDWQVVPPPGNFTTPPSSSACPLPLWCMLPAPNSGQLEVGGRLARSQRNPEQSWVAAQASQVMPPLKVGSSHILSALCCVCWVLTCCPQTHKVLGPRWRKGWNSQLHQREGKGREVLGDASPTDAQQTLVHILLVLTRWPPLPHAWSCHIRSPRRSSVLERPAPWKPSCIPGQICHVVTLANRLLSLGPSFQAEGCQSSPYLAHKSSSASSSVSWASSFPFEETLFRGRGEDLKYQVMEECLIGAWWTAGRFASAHWVLTGPSGRGPPCLCA